MRSQGGVFILVAVALCLVIFVLVVLAWQDSPLGDSYDRANRLWSSDRSAAVAEYKRLLGLRNSLFGGPIPADQVPEVYQRIVDHEATNGSASSAAEYLQEAYDEGLQGSVVPNLQTPEARALARCVGDAEWLQALVQRIIQRANEQPDDPKTRADIDRCLAELGQASFDPKVCPELARQLADRLKQQAAQMKDAQLATRLKKAIAAATTAP